MQNAMGIVRRTFALWQGIYREKLLQHQKIYFFIMSLFQALSGDYHHQPIYFFVASHTADKQIQCVPFPPFLSRFSRVSRFHHSFLLDPLDSYPHAKNADILDSDCDRFFPPVDFCAHRPNIQNLH